jgi:hypothetical protein
MSDIVWYGLFPLFEQLFRFSFVNTDWNCSFNISALLLVSLCRNPILFFNGATPVHSCTTIRRKLNRKQKAHKKARRTKKKRDVDRYKRLQQEVQYEVRQTNKKYMEDVSTDYKENSKKFWSFIKSKGQEWTGVAPLKNKMGFLQSINGVLYCVFQSVPK